MNLVLLGFKAIITKDLRRELRSRETLLSGLLFSIILLAIIFFATAAGNIDAKRMGAGALWLCISFSGTIGLGRMHQAERDNGCYRALALYPLEGGWLFLAKYLTSMLLQGLMVLLLLPLLALFFQLDIWSHLGALAASVLLGLSGFTAIGTLTVVISANTRIKDILFPVIHLPLVVPVLLAGVNSSAMALKGQAASSWLQFLVAFNLVFLALGFLLYDFLLEE